MTNHTHSHTRTDRAARYALKPGRSVSPLVAAAMLSPKDYGRYASLRFARQHGRRHPFLSGMALGAGL